MRELSKEEAELAAELFAIPEAPPPHKGEGVTHLTVRFDTTRPGVIYWGPHHSSRKIRMRGVTVLSYTMEPKGKSKKLRQSLRVRTEDGRKWTGQPKSGTDVVILQAVKEER
jgi:hypothetical protein